MHRAARALSATLVLGLTLTGCSGTSGSVTDSRTDPPSATAPGSSLLPAAEGKTHYPLTLETPWGKTVLSARPQRVASLSTAGVDAELLGSLGVKPVAVSETVYKNAPWTAEVIGRAPLVYAADDLSPEKIASAEPDLLVAFGQDESKVFGQLSQVAPVVGPRKKLDDYFSGITWKDSLRIIGQALDLQERAEEVIADQAQRLSDIKNQHPEFQDRTVNFVAYYGSEDNNQIQSYTIPDSDTDRLFTSIGFAPASHRRSKAESVGMENMAEIDADLLILSNRPGGTAPMGNITANPLYQRLDAVKKKHVVILDAAKEKDAFQVAWAIGAGKVLGERWLLDRLVPRMSSALS